MRREKVGDGPKDTVRFDARQYRLQLDNDVANFSRFQCTQPVGVDPKFKRDRPKRIDCDPPGLFACAEFFQRFRTSNELIHAFCRCVDNGPSVVGHLQEIHTEAVKNTSVFSAEIGPLLEGSFRSDPLVGGTFFNLQHRMSNYKETLISERVA